MVSKRGSSIAASTVDRVRSTMFCLASMRLFNRMAEQDLESAVIPP